MTSSPTPLRTRRDYLDMSLAENWSAWPVKARTRAAGIRLIRQDVAKAFGLSEAQLVGPSRKPDLVRARWIAAYRMREEAQASTSLIGLTLNRDHSSILHAIRKVEASPDLLARARSFGGATA